MTEEKKEELFDPNFPAWHPRNYSRRAKPEAEEVEPSAETPPSPKAKGRRGAPASGSPTEEPGPE